MSGEPMVVTVDTASGESRSFPVVLKKIMEMPPPNILDGDDDIDKEKLCDVGNMGGGIDDMGPSAALTPAIWDKTIPYDGETFHLEYMDLEEFLMENGIANSMVAELETSSDEPEKTKASSSKKAKQAVSLIPTQELDKCDEEVVIFTSGETDITCTVTADACSDDFDDTSSSVDPDEVEVEVNYEPDPTDLVLSSVPGGELFDPRKHKFSEEELKPQPMIKKAKKVYVPEEQKDDKYWQRRNKNNVAAKRSRDARRLKENQITVRAAFLERENRALRLEVADLRKECTGYKDTLGSYESKFGKFEVPGDK